MSAHIELLDFRCIRIIWLQFGELTKIVIVIRLLNSRLNNSCTVDQHDQVPGKFIFTERNRLGNVRDAFNFLKGHTIAIDLPDKVTEMPNWILRNIDAPGKRIIF